LQIEYSLLERTVERDLVPMARDQQMTVLAWSPLRNGLLTGKYLPENVKESQAEGARMHSEMMKGFGSAGESTDDIVRPAGRGAFPGFLRAEWGQVQQRPDIAKRLNTAAIRLNRASIHNGHSFSTNAAKLSASLLQPCA
jgi:hypothetical protein